MLINKKYYVFTATIHLKIVLTQVRKHDIFQESHITSYSGCPNSTRVDPKTQIQFSTLDFGIVNGASNQESYSETLPNKRIKMVLG